MQPVSHRCTLTRTSTPHHQCSRAPRPNPTEHHNPNTRTAKPVSYRNRCSRAKSGPLRRYFSAFPLYTSTASSGAARRTRAPLGMRLRALSRSQPQCPQGALHAHAPPEPHGTRVSPRPPPQSDIRHHLRPPSRPASALLFPSRTASAWSVHPSPGVHPGSLEP